MLEGVAVAEGLSPMAPPRARPTTAAPRTPPPAPPGSEDEGPLLGEDGQRVLHGCRELDYMTHIVLRMFENTK